MAEVELFGESFALNPREDYEWAMIEFSKAALGGADTDLLSGAAAVYDLLETAVTEDDWARFRALAKVKKAQTKRDLMPIVVQIFTQASERPTGLPSDSSDGQQSTPGSSAVDSSSEEPAYLRVVRDLESQGRPTVALMVLEANETAESKVSA